MDPVEGRGLPDLLDKLEQLDLKVLQDLQEELAALVQRVHKGKPDLQEEMELLVKLE